jgi:hypothetical protein
MFGNKIVLIDLVWVSLSKTWFSPKPCALRFLQEFFWPISNAYPFLEFADPSHIAYDIEGKVASELSIKIAWNEIT